MIEDDINNEQLRTMRGQNLMGINQQEMMMQEQERSMVKDQLDLNEELERIEHLLRGQTIKEDKNTGVRDWIDPEDNEMVLLSEYGIHLVLNTITWYINKNTLLSNYDDETIMTKMEDFASDLADTIFMEYEKVFQYPSFEDCQKILKERIDYKVKIKAFALETMGYIPDEVLIRNGIEKELENRIEVELNKIKEQVIKNKLKRFMLLLRVIQDAVHSTYNRAFKGMERRTLREHIHITENMGSGSGSSSGNSQSSGWSPLNWFQRKNK